MNKSQAEKVVGGLSKPSKMPCKAISLPTVACKTGALMARVEGSICSQCYANKGNYIKYAATIAPAQHRRLKALDNPLWIPAMVAAIGNDAFFRWHDSGDIQDVLHLRMIAEVARQTPGTRHWLPTREYGMVKDFIRDGGIIPPNLTIRLSAMFPDVPVDVPKSLHGLAGIATSNVHRAAAPIGKACPAYDHGGACGSCRACWDTNVKAVSYPAH